MMGDTATHLSVPTPPASSRNATPSCRDLPTHRWANARRMWPWATISTSPSHASSLDLPITRACHLSRISRMSLSSLWVMSAGLLSPVRQLSEGLR